MLRQLWHEFGSVLALVEQGEAVAITNRGKPIAVLAPPAREKTPKAKQRSDFAARLKRIYGETIVPGDFSF